MNMLLKKGLRRSGRYQQQPGQNVFPLVLSLLLAVFFFLPALAQNNVYVKGKVSGENGQVVPKASIMVKGTSTGTTADDNGNFEITAPSNGVLIVSAINFLQQEVKISNRQTINIVLISAEKIEGEVIVVGYGTQRKEAVTGSVATVGAAKIREVPSANLSQAMQGRIAGVQISQTSSKPGAAMQIRIRGQRSLTASNDPLIVLDGIPFPGNIADINPTDVKSIDILKDASATAIYGSRGANGVILITTNRGQKGKARISYNGYYGWQTLFARYPMMDGPEFAAFRKAANKYTNGVDEADSINTDWQDLFYNKTGAVTTHDLSLSGGTEGGSYSFGANYYQNQSLIPTQKYTRYSLRASLDQQVGKYFRVGFTTNSNFNQSEGNQVGLYGILSMSPIANPYNADGSLKRTVRMPLDESWVYTNQTTKDLQDVWLNETRGFATFNAIYGEVRIPWVDGLKYRANLGLDFIQSNNGNFTGMGITSTTATTVSTAGVSNSQTYHWIIEHILSYDRTFNRKHTVNAVALYSAEQNKYNSSSMSAKDIPADAFQFYNLGQAAGEVTLGDGVYNLRGLMSWMGRVMYSYDGRYMLSATVRSDASSVLAPGHKWHTYPAISAGWNISNESFMSNVKVIDRLKLRAGYGETSNQAVNPYQTLGLLSTRPYNFGNNTYSTGYYVSQLPNAQLGWEFSETWNVGVDFALLKNRLSGTIEYYVTNTKDLLMGVNLPITAGVPSVTSNVGRTQNKGLEFTLNGTIIENRNGWTWEAGFNIYTNKNRLVALATGQLRDEGNGWFVGHNIDAIYDFKKIGLWTSSKDSADGYLNTLVKGGNVGMIKVLYTGTFDGNGRPTRAIGNSPGADDRQIMDVDPDFEGGFNTRVAYKGFDLSIVGFFKSGGILVSSLYSGGGYLNLLSGRRGNVKVDYWTPDNTDAKYPKPGGIMDGDNAKFASTLGYFDASYMKIRTITLGYDFSRSVIKNTDMKMRMYFTVQNPFVMFSPYHKESGMDPETNSYGNENAAVPLSNSMRRILTIGTNTPATRNYVIGVNLTL